MIGYVIRWVKRFNKVALEKKDSSYFEKSWNTLFLEIESHLHEDPRGPHGREFAKEWDKLQQEMIQSSVIEKLRPFNFIKEPTSSRKVLRWISAAKKASKD